MSAPSKTTAGASSSPQIEIRTLTEQDAPAFKRLRQEALELDPKAFGEAAEEHRKTSIETVVSRLAATNDDKFTLGAFLDGQLVGTVRFARNETIKRRHKGHVHGMYVAPAARGRGAGRALMTVLLERVRAVDGIDEVLLSVTSSQSAAKKLYLSLGFEQFGRERAALRICGEFVDEDYMALRLVGE